MTKYRKRVLSLLLTASMIFTMNSFAFGEEINAGESAATIEASDVVLSTGTNPTTETQPEEEAPVAISADKVLSENLAEINENLTSYDWTETTDYIIVFPKAVAFGGKDKPGSKNFGIDVQVYKKVSKSVSGGDIVSGNGALTPSANNASVVTKLAVKKASIKAAKGATVELDGSPLFEAKKSTYIKGIKLADKTENKAFNAALKETFKAGKKSTEKVSANGLVDGKDVTSAFFTIAVYPCYVGNDADAAKLAKEAGLEIGTINTAKTKWDKSKVAIVNADGKKKTLTLTKKQGKYKGLDFAGKQTCTADTNSLKATEYFMADGDYAGNIYKQ